MNLKERKHLLNKFPIKFLNNTIQYNTIVHHLHTEIFYHQAFGDWDTDKNNWDTMNLFKEKQQTFYPTFQPGDWKHLEIYYI